MNQQQIQQVVKQMSNMAAQKQATVMDQLSRKRRKRGTTWQECDQLHVESLPRPNSLATVLQ